MSEADRPDPEALRDDLADGLPDPDEGWIHSVEEVAFDARPHARSKRTACPGCGETFRQGIETHVKAVVKRRGVDGGIRVRLCSWDCWQEWAPR